jgi:uncharacterized membrane protein YfcA
MITIVKSIPFPLLALILLFGLVCAIYYLHKYRDSEYKNLRPLMIWIAIGSVIGIVTRFVSEYTISSITENAFNITLMVWIVGLFIVLIVTMVVRHKKGQIPPEELKLFKKRMLILGIVTVAFYAIIVLLFVFLPD